MKVIVPVICANVPTSVLGIMDILNYSQAFSNQLSPQKKKKNTFEVILASAEKSKTINCNGYQLVCHTSLLPFEKADLVVVPAAVGNMAELVQKYPTLVQWILQQQKKGAAICSTCTGAFFVAATGLLDGKEATTSWFASDYFRMMFPKVKLLDEKIIVDNGKIVTGGATLSFMNLCIYLVEKYYGKELGNYCAKMFLVDKGKISQNSYSIFSVQKSHQDTEILKAQDFIEAHAQEKLTVGTISDEVLMSERTFIRRFKAATGNLPSEYIQRVKVEHAKKLLEEGQENIKEISYKSGYEDLNYFRDIFKRYTGLTPMEYKKMYSFSVD